MSKFVDLTNQVFGDLTVIKRAEDRYGRTRWLCRCSCGKYVERYAYDLKYGNITSCGCKKYEKISKKEKLHGMSKTKFYKKFYGMKSRCYNPNNKRYKNYGGRGIVVCEQWKNNFQQFVNDMGEKPNSSYSIDRIDVDGNYEPYNCRWATSIQQANNKQNSNHNYKNKLKIIYLNIKSNKNMLGWATFIEFYQDMLKSYVEHCEKYGEKNTFINRINKSNGFSKENCYWGCASEL